MIFGISVLIFLGLSVFKILLELLGFNASGFQPLDITVVCALLGYLVWGGLERLDRLSAIGCFDKDFREDSNWFSYLFIAYLILSYLFFIGSTLIYLTGHKGTALVIYGSTFLLVVLFVRLTLPLDEYEGTPVDWDELPVNILAAS
jgi:hypothetical protein